MYRDPRHTATAPASGAGGVARQVLSVLSSELRLIYPDIPARALVRYLDEMHHAMGQAGPENLTELLNRMRRAGIRDTEIADFYIPVVARRLGEQWVSDELEFLQVTTGMANLRAMLHTLDASWCTPERAPFGTLGEVCVVVPQGVQHSFGASILAGQIRRAGYDVRLGNNLPLDEIADFVSASTTSGIMLSASRCETPGFLRDVVSRMRSGNPWAPVLIGGNVLETGQDLCALTGADYATNDWQSALSFCKKRVAS